MANLDTTRLTQSGKIIGETLTCLVPTCGLVEPLALAVREVPLTVNEEVTIKRLMVGCTQCQTLQLIAAIEC